ncbi:MAG: C39 family peptidase [Actinobacteria bacterium]|nr:C39 family peptidase [Actinomycetota bacterium]
MSVGVQRRGPTRATVRRRRSLVVLALLAGVVGVAIATRGGSEEGGAPAPPPAPAVVRLELGGTTLGRISARPAGRAAAIAAALREIPSHRVATAGEAKITYAVDRAAAGVALRRALARGSGTVSVPERPISSHIAVPMIAQRLRDDCETTALSMVLGYGGRPVDQLVLQRQVAHALPLDPETGPNGEEIWGDPSLGFVGRADGGGPAGGFGVYQDPIRALARRHGLVMTDLSGTRPERLYAALLAGRPVLAWVALSAGPYASWTSPEGKEIQINYGEHAVVLTGVDGGEVYVNDPLSGERLTWSKAEFARMWAGLGKRALAA